MPGSRAEEERHLQSAQLLVVDDEHEVLEMLVDLLHEEGFSTVSTTDSREAIRLLDTQPFEVLVSDVVMPHLNGLQLLELAKAKDPTLQVLLITAYATGDVAQEALTKGAAGLIEKPFVAAHVYASVREALRRSRLLRGSTD